MKDEVNGDFRETELGALPAEWEVTTLGDVASAPLKNGIFVKNPTWNTGIPYLNVADVYARAIIDPAFLKRMEVPSRQRNGFEVKEGDLFFVRSSLKRQGIAMACVVPVVKEPTVFDNHLIRLAPNTERVDPIFLAEYCRSPLGHPRLVSLSKTTTMTTIPQSNLARLPIPLPPLIEQRAIARVLSTIQRAIGAQDKLIAAARELKKSLLRQLFAQGLDANGAVKETEIGVMPEHWELKRIGEVALRVGSGITPRGGSKTYLDKGIPLIRSQNVLMNRLSLEDVAFISQDVHASMQRSEIKPDDVLLNITGASIGRVAVVPKTLQVANVNQHVCCIRLNETMNPYFLTYFFATDDGQHQIMSTQFGATRQGLNYQQVRAFFVPCPSLNEQRKIARILATVDKKIETEEKRKAALEALFKTMLRQLMTGQIRLVDAAV